jgi:hypothetical protein
MECVLHLKLVAKKMIGQPSWALICLDEALKESAMDAVEAQPWKGFHLFCHHQHDGGNH